jgi:hypothetical protein
MNRNTRATVCRAACRRWFWALALLAVFLLHQDCWNWARVRPLVLGVLPAGLAYHAAYALGCALVMALLVRFAWPKHLGEAPPASSSEPTGGAADAPGGESPAP